MYLKSNNSFLKTELIKSKDILADVNLIFFKLFFYFLGGIENRYN